MSKFQRADKSVTEMASHILNEFETHQPLVDAEVKIDFVFAFPDYDATTGEPINDALKHHGVKALGICRKLPLKDRALGRGDAEISIDGHWWEQIASEEQKAALLDHEMHHIAVTEKRDDLGRPILKMRKHDVEIGWFAIIAKRHGLASQERMQAAAIMERAGQYFWPEIAGITSDRGEVAARSVRSAVLTH